MKNPRMNNPDFPLHFPILTLRLSDTFPIKSSFFCSKYKTLGFPQFPCRSY